MCLCRRLDGRAATVLTDRTATGGARQRGTTRPAGNSWAARRDACEMLDHACANFDQALADCRELGTGERIGPRDRSAHAMLFGLVPSCSISAFLQWSRWRLRCCSLEALPHRRWHPRGL